MTLMFSGCERARESRLHSSLGARSKAMLRYLDQERRDVSALGPADRGLLRKTSAPSLAWRAGAQ